MIEVPHIYSFTALFEDGTVIEHNHSIAGDDKSRTTELGSRFTDVQAKEKESKLITFTLHNEELVATVDLRDGHFELNGVAFFQHRPDLEAYSDYRVTYWRTVRHVMNPSGEVVGSEILGYGIGWQANDSQGKSIKRFIMV